MKVDAKKRPATREDRVAAALRENLRKRKAQAQKRAGKTQYREEK